MIKIGLTGPIGAGKGEAAKVLASLGICVVYADQVSRDLYEPGREGYAAVVETFGNSVLGEDGRIDRRILGEKVFASEAERRRLEAAVWPLMAREVERRFAEAEATGATGAALEAAVLFEAGWDVLVDEVWAVTAPEELLIARVKAREPLESGQIKARLKAQLTGEEKARRADRVVPNDGDLAALREQVQRAWSEATGQEN
jgi:dephospho-CoA kinase